MHRFRALIGLFVVVAATYVLWKVVPPYFNNYQFQDAVENEALLNTYSSKSEAEMRNALAKKARDYDIPLGPDQINVMRNPGEVSIWADYTVRVDLPLFPFDLKFHPATKNKRV